MAKKLTTEEKLALARSQDGGGAGSSPGAAESEPPAAKPAEPATTPAVPTSTSDILAAARAQSQKSEGAAPKAPASAATPGSTADILAAARAQKAGAAKPAAAAAPSSTADILAAARAQKSGGGGAAAAKPAAKKTPAKKAKAASGETPSVAEMLKTVRKADATPDGKIAKGPVAAKPKFPAKKKPAVAKAKKGEVNRRGLIAALCTPFAIAWIAIGSAGSIFGLLVARFMMPNVLVEPPTKFKIGPPSDFPPEAVVTKFKAARGIWVVNTNSYNGSQMIYALASVCTHLGCTPSWLEGEQKYKCPCHGSGFYKNGVNFEGPAPRPLERVGLRLAEDGMLEVDKSLKFQEEMGQWEDPSSFHALA